MTDKTENSTGDISDSKLPECDGLKINTHLAALSLTDQNC